MKVAPRDSERFVKNPPDACRTILLYGPDQGLARARRDQILQAWGVDRADAFAFQELSMAQITEAPSALHEALCSVSLMGDALCTTIGDASDKLTATLKSARSEAGATNPLILLAGDVPARSSLRRLCEDAKASDYAAIACYRDEGAGLAQFIRSFMQSRQIRCDQAAIAALVSLLGNDRAVTAQELEKIDLYLGEERLLDEHTVMLLLADNRHSVLADSVLAFFSGDHHHFISLSEHAFQAGESPVAWLRIAQSTATKLVDLQRLIAEGQSAEAAMKRMRPPIFFKDMPLYRKALQRMNQAQLLEAQALLLDLELAAKRTSDAQTLLYQRLLL